MNFGIKLIKVYVTQHECKYFEIFKICRILGLASPSAPHSAVDYSCKQVLTIDWADIYQFFKNRIDKIITKNNIKLTKCHAEPHCGRKIVATAHITRHRTATELKL